VVNSEELIGGVKTECDGTRAETRFGLPAKRTIPFISAGMSVQSAAGSLAAEVCASAVVMQDRPCSDTVQDCWLPTPFASFPFTSPPVLRRVPPDFVSTLPLNTRCYR